jgi:hypothetical protein
MNGRALLSLCALLPLLGVAAPLHLQTADHFAGYAGTRVVPPKVAAQWLTWAETDFAGSHALRRYGVKTMLYTDPNRVMKGDADFPNDDSAYARDCGNTPIQTARRPGQFLTDPRSRVVLATWRGHVARYMREGGYDAVFEDDANTVEYSTARPCNFDAQSWLRATIAMQAALGFPIIYNGLNNFSDRTVSLTIGLNQTALGGMMEECYGSSPSLPKLSGDRWYVAEQTELEMAAQRKLFFCYDNDTEQAAGAVEARMYVLASFLLTYDSATSVLWEYFQGPSHFHVMPEVQLVPLQPLTFPRSIDELRTTTGLYERRYRACYLAGREQGPCAIVVNSDPWPHDLDLRGYRRTLQINGAGIVDGGTVRVSAAAPPSELNGLSAVVAFE